MQDARPFLDADFPGYAEAVARENLVRGAACLGLNEKICGLEVRPLTAWHVRWLVLIRSPFLLRGFSPTDLATSPGILPDIMRFLWIVSPQFRPGVVERRHRWQRRTARDHFNRAFAPVMAMRAEAVCRELLDYVDEAYIDAGEPTASDKSYYEFEVAIAHELHEHYGYRVDFWNPMPPDQNPIHVPLKLVFQFRKLRQQMADPRAVVSNRSEQLISRGLEIMNRRDQYERDLSRQPPPVWPETLRIKPFTLN